MNGIMSSEFANLEESIDISNRKELEELAKKEELSINFNEFWKFWDKLVQETKEDIKYELQDYRFQKRRKHKNVYVYNKDFQLVKSFFSILECADYFNYSPSTIQKLLCKEIPWSYDQRFYFSEFPLEKVHLLKEKIKQKEEENKKIKDVIERVRNLNYENGWKSPIVYAYNLQGKLLNKFLNAKEAAEDVGVSPEQINYYINQRMPYYKANLIFTREKL